VTSPPVLWTAPTVSLLHHHPHNRASDSEDIICRERMFQTCLNLVTGFAVILTGFSLIHDLKTRPVANTLHYCRDSASRHRTTFFHSKASQVRTIVDTNVPSPSFSEYHESDNLASPFGSIFKWAFWELRAALLCAFSKYFFVHQKLQVGLLQLNICKKSNISISVENEVFSFENSKSIEN